MQISAIICTHNPREDYLRRVLEALRIQTLPFDRWELILIDNASDTQLSDRINLSWHPNARIVREEKLGKMYAWFKGINMAHGDILIFIDDDNVLNPDYLEQALDVAVRWPFIGVWGASVMPEFESMPPAWTKSEIWRLSIEEVKEDVWSNVRDGFETKPMGAGMCIRKEVGAKYLEWCQDNEMSYKLDRTGKMITGYGDMNLALCAIDIGLGTGKSSRLHLIHLIPSSRLTLDYFVRQSEGDAMSMVMYRALRGFSLEKIRPTLYQTIKWKIYRILSRQPKEILKIHDAYLRGLRRGFQTVNGHSKQ